MAERIAITILCAVGLYVALFMLAKTRRSERGELAESSVVELPRARLLGPPNALLGAAYYPAMVLGVWVTAVVATPWLAWVLALLALIPAIMSVILGYSLLFVTRRACPYCWTAHVCNWLLAALLAYAAITSWS